MRESQNGGREEQRTLLMDRRKHLDVALHLPTQMSLEGQREREREEGRG